LIPHRFCFQTRDDAVGTKRDRADIGAARPGEMVGSDADHRQGQRATVEYRGREYEAEGACGKRAKYSSYFIHDARCA